MRVASLLPSATETPFALGIEPVGVSHGCDQPPATRSLPTLTSTVVDHEDRTAGDVDAQMRSVEGVVCDLAVDRLRKRAADAAAGGRPRTAVLDWTDPPIRAGHRVRDMVDIAGGDPSFQPVGASEPVA